MSRTSFMGLMLFVSLVALGLGGPTPAGAQSISTERALLSNGPATSLSVRDVLLTDEPSLVRLQVIDPEQALLGASRSAASESTRKTEAGPAVASDEFDGWRALLGGAPSDPAR